MSVRLATLAAPALAVAAAVLLPADGLAQRRGAGLFRGGRLGGARTYPAVRYVYPAVRYAYPVNGSYSVRPVPSYLPSGFSSGYGPVHGPPSVTVRSYPVSTTTYPVTTTYREEARPAAPAEGAEQPEAIHHPPAEVETPPTGPATGSTRDEGVRPAADPSRDEDLSATVKVVLPSPDAELWVEGEKQDDRGTRREIHSPPLRSGRRYTYSMRARWQADGGPVEETRRVNVYAGDRVTVDFTLPARKEAPAEVVPREYEPPQP